MVGSSAYSFDDTFVTFKIFGTPNDYDLVAGIVVPASFKRARELTIKCVSSGKVAGRVVGPDESRWHAIMSSILPDPFVLVQAVLTDFSTFERNDEGELLTPEDLIFQIVTADGTPIAKDMELTWYGKRTLPVPSRDNIIRVAGDVGVDGFLFGGATWHARLESLVRRHLGSELNQLRILDWGVGCGRIARHLLERGHPRLFGADIDQLNIDWLRQHLDWRDAVRVDFDPPMPYPDQFFDVVYGHSVFTHLGRADHVKWISEIRRILRPGGLALLTIASDAGAYLTRKHDFDKIRKMLTTDGFADAENQSYVGVDEGRAGYYRLVFQSRDFIRKNWGDMFEILSILPCNMEHQDLVVVRRPE